MTALGRHACMQAIKCLNMIKVHGKPIRVNKASQDKKQLDVGANLFIGNIDPDVDEKVGRSASSHPACACPCLGWSLQELAYHRCEVLL